MRASRLPIIVAGLSMVLAGGVVAQTDASSGGVTYERLLAAEEEPGNWLTYSGQYHSQRFSGLDQINNGNVERLELAWVRQLLTSLAPTVFLACVSTPGPDGPFDATAVETRSCRPLGEVLGESIFCNEYLAMESAREQAHALGATHILWTNVRCVVFVGEKASARIFDCDPEVALDDSPQLRIHVHRQLAPSGVSGDGLE